MDLTAEQVRDISWDDSEEFELVEESEWEQEHKYQHQNIVFKPKNEERFFEVHILRSGSPYTDWHYCYEDGGTYEATEVVQKEVTVTQWVAK